ncbi:hypothetical protein [Nostoc sp. ChiQUE01b]|uniref:hypothetical protein n=1 Tax=Nostoc sp. ChiQUE01b TaxID=3075376 RepID=UPI002AD271A0|nr:hypothetical protein [Nostoc sp. ChiQUE01b]MDZ8260581.1 hypothetical protein [Nostoc sp. ChiQUE01b]
MLSPMDFVEPADWTRRKKEFNSEAWLCLYQQAWIEGYVYGRQEEWNDIIVNLLISRFGKIDEKLQAFVNPLQQNLATSSLSILLSFLSTLSDEEFLKRLHNGSLMNDLTRNITFKSSSNASSKNLKNNKKYSTLQAEQTGWQDGQQTGMAEERNDIIRNLLVSQFGVIDEELEATVNPLTALPTSEFSSLLLSLSNLSREQLLARFG